MQFNTEMIKSINGIVLYVGIGFSLLIFIVNLIVWILLFKKAERKGILAIVPIYNIWVFFEIATLPGWLCLIPIANIFSYLAALYKIPVLFNKSKVFAVFNVLTGGFLLMFIAFSRSHYEGSEELVQAISSSDAVNLFRNKYMGDDSGVEVDKTEIAPINQTTDFYEFKEEPVKEKVEIDPFVDLGLKTNEVRDDKAYDGTTTIAEAYTKRSNKFIINQDNDEEKKI